MNSSMDSLVTSVFRRDGHFSEMAMELWISGELDDACESNFRKHLGECSHCGAALREMQVHENSFAISPSAKVIAAASEMASSETGGLGVFGKLRQVFSWSKIRRSPSFLAGSGIVAAAAIAVLLVLPQGESLPQNSTENLSVPSVDSSQANSQDNWRRKSTALDFEVLVHNGEQVSVADSDTRLRAGDRLRFRVHSREKGHLFVFGVDAGQQLYPCYPQQSEQASPVEAMAQAQLLDTAVEIDATPGYEHLVALHCPRSFSVGALRTQVLEAMKSWSAESSLKTILPECQQQDLRLYKVEEQNH